MCHLLATCALAGCSASTRFECIERQLRTTSWGRGCLPNFCHSCRLPPAACRLHRENLCPAAMCGLVSRAIVLPAPSPRSAYLNKPENYPLTSTALPDDAKVGQLGYEQQLSHPMRTLSSRLALLPCHFAGEAGGGRLPGRPAQAILLRRQAEGAQLEMHNVQVSIQPGCCAFAGCVHQPLDCDLWCRPPAAECARSETGYTALVSNARPAAVQCSRLW